MNQNLDIGIVIPAYKNPTRDLEILESSIGLLDYPADRLRIIIVEILQKTDKSLFKKFKNKRIFISKRVGYAQAANAGILKVKCPYILLLNPDTSLDKELLLELTDGINTKKGIFGPLVYNFYYPKKISDKDLPGVFDKSFGVQAITPKNLNLRKKILKVGWVSGACMFFPKEVWEKVGGFDESWFMYWEDADFCMRAKRFGYDAFLLTKAKAWHKDGGNDLAYLKTYYTVRNNRVFLRRHSNLIGILKLHLDNILVFIPKLFKALYSENDKKFLTGLIDFYQNKKGRIIENR